MRQPPPDIVALLNKMEIAGSRVMLFYVPTRIIRVLDVDDTGHTFRVEQLVQTGHNNGSWRTLSTHGSEIPGQSWAAAVEAGRKSQLDLIAKLKARYPMPGKVVSGGGVLPGLPGGAPLR